MAYIRDFTVLRFHPTQLKFVPKGQFDNRPTVVLVKACVELVRGHYVIQCWPRSLVSMPSWGHSEVNHALMSDIMSLLEVTRSVLIDQVTTFLSGLTQWRPEMHLHDIWTQRLQNHLILHEILTKIQKDLLNFKIQKEILTACILGMHLNSLHAKFFSRYMYVFTISVIPPHWHRCDMAFIEPMHCNKPNITYLLHTDMTQVV